MTEPQTVAPEQSKEGAPSQSVGLMGVSASEAETQADTTESVKPGEAETEAPDAPEEQATEEQAPESAEPDGAPESYEVFETPEGIEGWDEGVIAAYSDSAKQAGLSQEQAQTVLNGLAPAIQQRQQEQREALVAGWQEAARKDAEFGGEKFDENLAIANKAYETCCSPELRELANQSGLNMHPEWIRAWWFVGQKAISEDTAIDGGPTKPRENIATSGNVLRHMREAARRVYEKT